MAYAEEFLPPLLTVHRNRLSTNAKDKYFCEELNGKRLNEGEDTVFFLGSHNGQGNLPSCLEVSAMAPENG